MPEKGVAAYVRAIAREYETGHAREHSYRPALKALIEAVRPELNAVNEPKQSEYGAPDIVVLRKKNKELIAGYVETKDLSVKPDPSTEQMKRYLGYHALILTNNLEFRFFKNGKEQGDPVVIGTLQGGHLSFDESKFARLEDELRAFFSGGNAAPIRSASHLAGVMGATARRLRDNVNVFLKEESDKSADLRKVFEAMKKLLVHDLTEERFADLYAQTLVYGLFAARYEDGTPDSFTRQEARDLIPATNPFLREFFDHIAGPSFEQRLAFIVNELCEVFAHANVKELMHEYYTQSALLGPAKESPDPVIHFYEDFLKEYDPEARKKYGVFYTPVPVVRFIVRSVDQILQRDFGLSEGLADTSKIEHEFLVQGKKRKVQVHKVQVLDPATGTGTFLNEVIRFIRRSFDDNMGAWPGYVRDHLLPRLHGFELLMASYTVAHLKLGMELAEDGAEDLKERLGIYLTNSLEEGVKQEDSLFALGFAETIAEEGNQAAGVKRDLPVMVVIGNPPYQGESSNKFYSGHDVYKKEPTGGKLLEKNSKWINDDYVKFIRLAESFIEKSGEGVVAMITAHGYIDNPTFRGMRWHLMQTFNEIYVLDLHGSANKKEKADDGSQDKNVFEIKTGVAIFIGVKRKKAKGNRVFRADLKGSRSSKFAFLNEHSIHTIDWQRITPASPSFAWIHSNSEMRSEYERGFAIPDLFRVSSVGIVTARDGMSIQWSKSEIEKVVDDFRNLDDEVLRGKYNLGKDVRDWKVTLAKKDVTDNFDSANFVPISYRPFDTRWTFFTGKSKGFHCMPRGEVMKHMRLPNIALVTARSNKNPEVDHFFVSRTITEAKLGESSTQSATFPLYLYSNEGTQVSNLNPEIVLRFTKSIGETEPEDIFDYVYAILYSSAYREKYKEFLKTDFPRVPYAKDRQTFDSLLEKGRELRKLHTLETKPSMSVKFPEKGDNIVSNTKRQGDRVYINATQYFDGVPAEVWDMHIGGYQPAQKWLKDRKGRMLSFDDIAHYGRIIGILTDTRRLMEEIDKIGVI